LLPGTTGQRPTGRRAASPEQRIAKVQASYGSSFRRTTGKKKPAILNLAIMAVVVPGLFCTVALPAYAFQEQQDASSTAALQALKESGAQTVEVGDDVVLAAVARDSYKVTSAAEMRRAALAAAYRSWSGPTVRQLLANPPYPRFSLDQVVAVAKKYQGVPYRYGGADPSGFDCSGFTQYVYAQFGVALPHSASRQGSGGTAIAASAALPGDLVVMDGGGHVGIYLGGNMMIDAATPGTVVAIRPIYNPSHWFVRYGI
jgi:cell wall-associated NlpC family hydrolase